MRSRFWVLGFLLVYASCDSNRVFEANHDFESRVWRSDDIRKFDFEILDTDQKYNIYFTVRNTMEYPHYNLYISCMLEDSVQNVIYEELKNVDLFDPKTGSPYGKSGLGDIYDHRFAFVEEFEFEFPGTKTLKLQQFMRYDSLPELVSTGIRVETVEQFKGY